MKNERTGHYLSYGSRGWGKYYAAVCYVILAQILLTTPLHSLHDSPTPADALLAYIWAITGIVFLYFFLQNFHNILRPTILKIYADKTWIRGAGFAPKDTIKEFIFVNSAICTPHRGLVPVPTKLKISILRNGKDKHVKFRIYGDKFMTMTQDEILSILHKNTPDSA